MKKRIAILPLAFVLTLFGNMHFASGQDVDSSEQTNRSWSLAFRADPPRLYVHEDGQGNRTPYLYITYRIRNNYDRAVPLEPSFVLETDHEKYFPASADPEVEHEIIVKEAHLRGFSKGVQKIKVRNLKKQGDYLNVDDINRGSFLQHIQGEGINQHEINPLHIRPFQTMSETEDQIPYQVMLNEGPTGQNGTSFEKRLSDHPAEIKGLLLFKGIDLHTRNLTLKVGNLVDPLIRVQEFDVPASREYRYEPQTLYLEWSWEVPRTQKHNRAPKFTRREMVKERFGPVATQNTLRRLIDHLSSGDTSAENSEKDTDNATSDRTIRTSVLQMLRDLTGQNFGYDPEADQSQNRSAITEWNRWWRQNKHDLVYVLARPDDQEQDQDLFYSYPEPKYIVLRKNVNVDGAESPQELYQSVRSAWNEQRWQDVMNRLLIDQRDRKTMKKLFKRYGFGAELGVARNFQETDREDRRVVVFNFEDSTEQLQIQRDNGQWFLRVPDKE